MKRKKTNFLSILCLTAIMLCSAVAFGQKNLDMSNSNSSITLKTMRALFPNTPVAIANEIHGGLHVVQTVNQLHGYEDKTAVNEKLALDNASLQIGMLVYVASENMYYRYKGPNTDDKKNASDVAGYTTTTTVNTTFWEPMSEILDIPETITVEDDCTNAYTFTDGESSPTLTINNIPETGYTLDKTGADTNTTPLPTNPRAGDHLILMPSGTSQPIATYVFDGTEWKLISSGTKVYNTGEMGSNNYVISGDNIYETDNGTFNTSTDITDQFLEGDVFQQENETGATETYIHDGTKLVKIKVDDNDQVEVLPQVDDALTVTDPKKAIDKIKAPATYGPTTISNYYEGDLVKLTTPNGSYITYALEITKVAGTHPNPDTYTRSWKEIARYISDADKATIKVYRDIGDTDGIKAFDYEITINTTTTTHDLFIDREDFLSNMREETISGSGVYEVKLEESSSNTTDKTIELYYPVSWPDFTISIFYDLNNSTTLDDGEKFELTNGISTSVIDISVSVDTSQPSGTLYKKITIYCGNGNTIFID